MALISNTYNRATPITLSDSANITLPNGASPMQAIYVGTKGSTGTLVAVFGDGSTATFIGLAAGTVLPINCVRVNSTTTDVSNLLALFQV